MSPLVTGTVENSPYSDLEENLICAVAITIVQLFVNRLFGELSHVLGYHLATTRWMVVHPSVHSDHKAWSAIGRGLRTLIQTSLIIE